MGIADFIKTRLPYFPNWITVPLMKLNFLGKWCYGRAYVNYGKTLEQASPEQRLLKIVNYAIEHVPYYRNLYRGTTVNSMMDFENKIGFIDKDTVVANWEQFASDEADKSKVNIITTGGTSGKPMRIMMPRNRYVFALFFTHRQYKKFGWNYDTIGVIRNQKLPAGRTYICNPVMKQIIFDAFRSSNQYRLAMWKTLKKFRIRYIHAYPSAAYSFLKYCYNNNLDISFLKVLFLSSESVTDSQYQFFTDVLGLQVAAEYGHSEKLCRASMIPGDSRYHADAEYGYMEVTGCRSDESCNATFGEIAGTTFMNYAFPLIRYKTGDYAYVSGPGPNLVLDSIEGRWDNSIIHRADGTYTSATALNLHSDLYSRIDGLQYVQEKRGYLIVNIIPGKDFSECDAAFIKKHYADAMGGDCYVEVRYVDRLELQKNGKFLPVISRCS